MVYARGRAGRVAEGFWGVCLERESQQVHDHSEHVKYDLVCLSIMASVI